MTVLVADGWEDYKLIDAGDGERLEKWGKFVLRRPDPQAIWSPLLSKKRWESFDACYYRSDSGGGYWEYLSKNMPKKWDIKCGHLSFYIEPTGFKHTGIFPEQLPNWVWLSNQVKISGRPLKVLNLFAYTGGATVSLVSAGAGVCHVDASKGIVQRAKDNVDLSGFKDRPIRFIVDDVMKFVKREQRRNSKYDGIVMDPPSYGRGPKGELWKLEDSIGDLVKECVNVMSDKPKFFLVNSYTTGISPIAIENVLRGVIISKFGGDTCSGEIGLRIQSSGFILPCGAYSRWESI